jgi:Transaldolase
MNIDFVVSKSAEFKKMQSYGQSPWLDNISRCMLDSGDLSKLVQNGIITGITSNPSIFEKAINSGKCGYPEKIKKLSEKKLTPLKYTTLLQ